MNIFFVTGFYSRVKKVQSHQGLCIKGQISLLAARMVYYKQGKGAERQV